LFKNHLLRTTSHCLCSFLKGAKVMIVWACLWVSYSFHLSTYLYVHQYHSLDTVAVSSHEVRQTVPQLCSPSILSWPLGLLSLHLNFRVSLQYHKRICWDFYGHCTDSMGQLGNQHLDNIEFSCLWTSPIYLVLLWYLYSFSHIEFGGFPLKAIVCTLLDLPPTISF
jgi:hypothetical protein